MYLSSYSLPAYAHQASWPAKSIGRDLHKPSLLNQQLTTPQFGGKTPSWGYAVLLCLAWHFLAPQGCKQQARETISTVVTSIPGLSKTKSIIAGELDEFMQKSQALTTNELRKFAQNLPEGFSIEIVDTDAPTGITYKGKPVTKGTKITLNADIKTVVEKIQKEKDTFVEVEKATGVPASLLGAIWYRENSCQKQTDSPGGPFQFYPAADYPEEKCLTLLDTYATGLTQTQRNKMARQGITNFNAAAFIAACLLQEKMALNNKEPLNPESDLTKLTDAAYFYNGKIDDGKENSPYVYNLTNPKSMTYDPTNTKNLSGVTETDDGNVYNELVDKRPGVAPIVAACQLLKSMEDEKTFDKDFAGLAESLIAGVESEEGGTEAETSLSSSWWSRLTSSSLTGSELVESFMGPNQRFHLPVASIENAGPNSEFGYSRGRLHNGLDCYAREGTNIHSIADGTVIFSGKDNSGLGYTVKIMHRSPSGEPFVSIYGHCKRNSLAVNVGDTVSAGDVIAGVGHTGNASHKGCIQHPPFGKNHVHLTIRLLEDGNLAATIPRGAIAKHTLKEWVVINPKVLLP